MFGTEIKPVRNRNKICLETKPVQNQYLEPKPCSKPKPGLFGTETTCSEPIILALDDVLIIPRDKFIKMMAMAQKFQKIWGLDSEIREVEEFAENLENR